LTVTVVITATGSLSEYDEDKKAEIAAAVAATLPGVSASDITVLVVAGSVVITVVVAVPPSTTVDAVRGGLTTSLGTPSAATNTLLSADVTVTDVVLPSAPSTAPSTASISVDMAIGWTWMSLSVQPADASVSAVLGDLPLFQGDYVKSQSTFSEYYSGWGFFGGLTTLTTDEMYQVKLAASGTLVISGAPVALPRAVSLSAGWTWLPCPYLSSVTLASGVPSFNYASGDQFKSQSQFAEFYPGYGWFGTLATLHPGSGYKLKVAGSGSATFPSV